MSTPKTGYPFDLSVPPKHYKTASERMNFMAHYRMAQMEQPGRGLTRVLS